MAIDVLMPKLSDTMEEGRIVKWLKHPGERVAIGDVLAEVETDKATMELEAYDEGVLGEVRTGDGESAPVGAVIATLTAPGEAAPAPAPKPAASTRSAARPQAATAPLETSAGVPADAAGAAVAGASRGEVESPGPGATSATPAAARPAAGRAAAGRAPARPAGAPDDGGRPKASPLARKLARELSIDLAGVQGTGPGGRIVERDVQAAKAAGARAPEGGAAPARPAEPARGAAAPASARPAAARPGTRIELSRMRRTTAKRMADAKRDVPHFYASADVAMDEAVRMKAQLAALGGEYEGVTLTHLLVKAVGLALARVPEMNASLDGDGIVLHGEVNVGIATAVDDGLLVPVAHGCDREPLRTLVPRIRALVARARSGKLQGDDLTGATFSVSNLGMFPVSQFAAVVNPPQAAILAVGTVRDVPVVRDGRIVPGKQMTVTLSCDHRIVDGALAGRFLRELVPRLEQPLALLA